MALLLVQELVTAFELACVVVLCAYLFTRSRLFAEFLESRASHLTKLLLAGAFGLLSIFGMSSGIVYSGAVVNVRDLGPIIAGLLCGPAVGLGAGLIGGAYRLSVGGANVYAAALGPVIAGAASGFVYYYNKKALVSTKQAILVTVAIETGVSVLALAVRAVAGDPLSTILTVFINVAVPMIAMTTISVGLFTYIAHALLRERQLQRENQQLALERESQKNLSLIINTIANPVFVKDRNHRLTLVNDGFCQLCGREDRDLIGKTEYDCLSPPFADLFRQNAEEAFRTGKRTEIEGVLTGADGRLHTVVVKISPYTDTSGHPYLVGVITDISDRKRMEDALVASEQLYRTVFETTGMPTILFGDNSIILLVNAEFEEISGYSREEIEGKMSWSGFIHPEDRDRILAQYTRVRSFRDLGKHHYEFRFRAKTGDIRTLDLILAAIPGTDRYIASMMDVTEITRSRKILELVNKKINLLSSITRHDILNQLMVLKGYLSLSTTMAENPVLADYINKELVAAQTIEHQINFTRDYENMGVRSPEWQNINGLLLKARRALVRRDIAVVSDPRNPDVYADPLFEKVLYNLTDNALRYGGEKMTEIRVSSRTDGENLIITFEDNGAGIADPDKQHLFKRGFGKNTGFGLFLSREILSITNITIAETGIPGTGARFEITVPRGAFRLNDHSLGEGEPGPSEHPV